MLCTVVLFIFCPIFSMKVELNDNLTRCTYNVSIFSALAGNTANVNNFLFSTKTDSWQIALIILLQIIGILIMMCNKKSYIVGIVVLLGSWLWLTLSSCIVINVQSDLFNEFGAVTQQSVSVFVGFTILIETLLITLKGIHNFGKIKDTK